MNNSPKLPLVLFFGLLSANTFAQETAPTLPDPVAIVNEQPVPLAVFTAYKQQRSAQGEVPNTAEAQKGLIEEIVVQELLVQEAEKQNLQNNPDLALQLELLRRNLMATSALRKVLAEKAPSEEEISKAYETASAQMVKDEYKARHILVESEELAKEIIGRLDGGADFAVEAKEHSSDTSSEQGGDLGWFSAEVMVEPFGAALSQMEKGSYTKAPVETQFGWHVIQLDDIRKSDPPPMEQMRPQIMQMIQGNTINDYLDSLRAGAKVELR